MPKTKLDIISHLHSVESRLDALLSQRKALTSNFFKGGSIQFTINSTDAHQRGHKKAIPFDRDLMLAYLTTEIDKLNKESDELLVELSQFKR